MTVIQRKVFVIVRIDWIILSMQLLFDWVIHIILHLIHLLFKVAFIVFLLFNAFIHLLNSNY